MTTLVMIPVPADEAKLRLARAKQDAKAARKQMSGLLQFGPKDQRTARKVAGFAEVAQVNDRIAEGCVRALEDAASSAPDDDEPVTRESVQEQMRAVTGERRIPAMAVDDEQPEPVLMAADVDETGG